MDLDGLSAEMFEKRKLWREAREKRLRRKEELLVQGVGVAAVRNDREYRRLKKEQHALTVALRHLEIKMNRKLAFAKKKK